MSITIQQFSVGGMQCPGCEDILEEAVSRVHGVQQVRADYAKEIVEVTFDSRKAKRDQLVHAILGAGYSCASKAPEHRWRVMRTLLAVLIGIAGIALILWAGQWAESIRLPAFDQQLSYGLLFLVGLLTGFHCVGMCGGFVLGYTARNASLGRHSFALAHFMYGMGKTLSYTVIGGLFGLLGSVVAFTPMLRGVAGVVAGVFLVLMGLSMLKVFPALRLGLRMPGFLQRFIRGEARRHRSPLAIGLLNGLMIACGPLQAMYVMAAGTGSFVEGAKRLFVFGTGTLPILLGFGMMASLVSHRATEKILKLSAVFVMAIGLLMVNRGLILTGTGYDMNTLSAIARVEAARWVDFLRARLPVEEGYQVIRMTVTKSGYRPDTFVLREGVPVKWVIDGRELTYCNRRIMVPALGLEIELVEGEQTVEFVPREAGVIPWSCWMGMLPGSFVVQPAEPPNDSGTGPD
ncbi:MAG: sulfite exporter TauE/SafE family protein [Methylotetracoccus sp.]|nr:sulfite exporter TauE/SafE family protein [Methylotetracoccus sp.]